MAGSKQANRLMQFSSSLGKDVLLIELLEGMEGISRLFEFRAELLADVDTEINPKDLIGGRVTVAIALNDAQGCRYVNGIVAGFEQCGGDAEFNVYRARIVPAFWQATLHSTCRVFQNKTVLEIAKSIFTDYGLSISDQTSNSYKPLDYCTQYCESDFHFVSRLFEESGIFYWFEHTDQDHRIILADDRDAYTDCPISSQIAFALNEKGAEGGYGARVIDLTSTATMVTGKHISADYDYRPYKRFDTPEVASASPFGRNGFERYVYPAGAEGYLKQAETQNGPPIAELIARSSALASDVVAEVYSGEANARSFCAGYTFTLQDHPRAAWNRKYLLCTVSHSAGQNPSYRTDAASSTGYRNHFTAIFSEVVFKPAPTAAKPRIYGPQTAIVVAPSGEDMYIDKLGRVCIQFFWDKQRQPHTIDNTWVRVAQQWAGNGWGTYFWPRLGDEVVVQFLNGDPDNPLVVGSTYNGVNVPKYALPDHSTRSGILTRSSKGGGAKNANELRFEDKTGSEQIFLNAERDMDHRVERDHRMYIGGKDSLVVEGDQLEEVDGKYGRLTKGDAAEKIQGSSDLEVQGTLTERVGANCSLQVGSNQAEKVGQNYSLDAGMEVYLKGGMQVVIEAGMELTLKAAGGFITIGPAGVAISGTMVLINSGGAAGSGSAGTVGSPKAPDKPDVADDGTKGGKM